MIPYGKQEIDQDDIRAVVECLSSEFLTQGPLVPKFEQELADAVGSEYSVAVNSATSALHLACLALGVGEGDVVWTSANSFVASANCALYCGAEVDFVDIDEDTGNMDLEDLARKLELASASKRLPKVVIPVHFAGQPVDMRSLSQLLSPYDIKVIEDASHALGATFSGLPVGSCEYSDITVFSFHPVKMITTGEGGIATTNSSATYLAMQRLRSHGITRDPNTMQVPFEGDWHYDQIELGYNYRMTDVYGALGLSQLRKLPSFVDKRTQIAERYGELLSESEHRPLAQHPLAKSSWHLYVVRISEAADRKQVFDRFRQNGVLVNVHYRPIYRQSFYSKMQKYEATDFPGTEKYYSRVISLPIFPSLTPSQQVRIVEILAADTGHQAIF